MVRARERVRRLCLDESERHSFGQPGRGEHAADQLIAWHAWVGRRRRRGRDRIGGLQLVEAVMAADFFDEVDLAHEVDPYGWRDDIPSIARARNGQAEM